MRALPAIAAFILLSLPVQAQDASERLAPCKAGDQDACLEGARLAQAAGDDALLITFSGIGCEHGNLISCSDEGMLIIAGVDPGGELQHGVDLVKKGCEGGYYRACTNLGYLYYTGTGVERDVPGAAQFYHQGCTGGSAAACRNLGLMVADDLAPSPDGSSAAELFNRACDLGDPTACQTALPVSTASNAGLICRNIGFSAPDNPPCCARMNSPRGAIHGNAGND